MIQLQRTSKRKSYFEGWYLKHQNHKQTIAFIPGYQVDEEGNASAFIQVITNFGSYQFIFPETEFYIDRKRSVMRIGENVFTQRGVSVNLISEKLRIKGNLQYGRLTPLKYDIMGPFRLLPMQCKHGIVSLHHTLRGTLTVNNEKICFDYGVGYIESDKGTSFPKSYIWTQCSIPKEQPSSIVAAVADIPIGPVHFNGCICCIYHKGKQYRISTYQGAKILRSTNDELVILQGKYMLRINVLKSNPFPLQAPQKGAMIRTIHESAACKVRYRFYARGKMVFDYTSHQAAFEFVEASDSVPILSKVSKAVNC